MADLSFNQQYHQDTVDQGKEMYNRDGSVTTAMVAGIELDGKIYNVPLYDRENQRILTEDQALHKWMPQIESGEIIGYDSKWDGEMEDHPANVAARSEHEMMDEYSRAQSNTDYENMDANEYRADRNHRNSNRGY